MLFQLKEHGTGGPLQKLIQCFKVVKRYLLALNYFYENKNIKFINI